MIEHYGTIGNETFINAAATTLNADASGKAPKCGWRYALCAAAIGFQGMTMLGACETATVGIGTPLCIAGVAVFSANGLAQCKKDHCK